MARPLRIECEDTFYHVLSRGNERRDIFRDDRDRGHFLELLGTVVERFETEIWSYVLMPNHYHLVLRTLRANLSRAIQWLGVSYAAWFNARHDRCGHLFQGRFKAFVIQDESYLSRLMLYVHRNPLRAGLVERLADYPWSSYRCLAYGRDCVEWLARRAALGFAGGTSVAFRRAVQSYSEEDERILEDIRYGLFLGSEEGFGRFLKRAFDGKEHREKPQASAARRALAAQTVEEAIGQFAERLEVSAEVLSALTRPKRHVRRPLRDVMIYLLWRSGAFRLAEIGEHFGVGYTSISNARKRGEAVVKGDRRIRALLRRARINDK